MENKIKIQIKSVFESLLFEYEKENNTIKDTVCEASLRGANLYGADLYKADLRGASLRGADLREADLRGADLRGANLYKANLYGASLRGASLRGADLYGANLYRADLYKANLRGASLRGANLYKAYLYGANLYRADLYGANLYGANLYGANLYGADLYGANLREANLEKLPEDFINQCSRDILFIFHCLKNELPEFKKKLLAGEIDGSQYEGECTCLVGTFAKTKGEDVEKICSYIPFYKKGIHNMGETWFLNIRKGDTPENNQFSAHVLKLIDIVLK